MTLRPPNNYRVYGIIAALACLAMGGGNLSAATLTAYRTHFTHGYYVAPGSLDEHLWEQWEARTNGRQPLILSNITMVNWNTAHSAVWNTNWYFYGNTENYTAQSHVRTNDADGWWTWRKSTVLSRVLILGSGHAMCYDHTTGTCGSNNWFLFLDATNGQHWRRVIHGLSRGSDGTFTNYPAYPAEYPYGDRYLAVLNEPLPTNVGTMKIVTLDVLTNKLDWAAVGSWPYFFNSQHSRTEGSGSFRTPYTLGGFWQTNTTLYTSLGNVWSYGAPGLPKTMYLTQTNPAYGALFTNAAFNTDNMSFGVMGQDSGSPTYIVVSNRLVFLGAAYQSPSLGDMDLFLQDVNTATTAGGYTTNDYPVELELLEGFPDL
jgi:hypothetical protein